MMETLLHILDWPMDTPRLYGWYHLLWVLIIFLAAWVLCTSYKHCRHPEAHIRKVVFYTAVLVAVFEVLHQINYNLVWKDDRLQLDMQWYAFPFQFCSTPMYVGLLTGLFKTGKVHDSLCAYLATYVVFAGICVMIYPGDVFTGTIITNVQTMICHGSMITVGIYLFYTRHVGGENKTFLRALPVFCGCLLIAMLLNEIAYRCGLLASGHTFNMFFISPYCEPSLPVYSLVQAALPYPFCLIVYVMGFSLAAWLVLLLGRFVCPKSSRQSHSAEMLPAASVQ